MSASHDAAAPTTAAAARDGSRSDRPDATAKDGPRSPLARLLEERPAIFAAEVLKKLPACDVAMLARTNRACRDAVKASGLPYNRLRRGAFYNSFARFEWAMENGLEKGAGVVHYLETHRYLRRRLEGTN
tara:strand:+ start:963 stop:1352 length:390 start_codon:yes stop_codon:yes gene_type:complete